MRMIMLVQCPIEPFNTAVRNGSVGATMKKIIDAIKPESIFFTEREGHRGAIAVVQVDSPSDVPRLAEPWFLSFNAEVEFRIAMTPEELGRANLEGVGKQWA
ncbi:MAG TPA: panthothenate synthetase [Terracidiphilus sp.]|nr:panthothenate synthetase [Terracidiphilus sp.]